MFLECSELWPRRHIPTFPLSPSFPPLFLKLSALRPSILRLVMALRRLSKCYASSWCGSLIRVWVLLCAGGFGYEHEG